MSPLVLTGGMTALILHTVIHDSDEALQLPKLPVEVLTWSAGDTCSKRLEAPKRIAYCRSAL